MARESGRPVSLSLSLSLSLYISMPSKVMGSDSSFLSEWERGSIWFTRIIVLRYLNLVEHNSMI
jgi:hypothetical protein